jgi:hypothetical protein
LSYGLEVLHICKKSQRLDRLEEVEIYRAHKNQPQQLINIQANFTANAIYEKVIRNENDSNDNKYRKP